MEDAASPLPKLETTPPVTKMYFGITHLMRIKNTKLKMQK
jgi:hypothetical protein